MKDHEELRRLALAATPGPWTVGTREDYLPLASGGGIDGPYPIICPPLGAPITCLDERPGLPKEQNESDAAFIAAANPVAILDLLDELEAAEERKQEDRG